MMKKILTLLLMTFIAWSASAQNVGYRGRHFILNAECSLSPAWLRPSPMTPVLEQTQLSESTQKYLGLNYLLSPNIEAIVWEKGTVGTGYIYYNSPFNGTPYESTTIGLRDYSIPVPFEGTMTAHGFNVFYKQYFGKTFAPMGHYFKFEFDAFFINYTCQSSMCPSNFSYFYGDTIYHGKDAQYGVKLEYGYDFLFFDRLRLTMGVSFGSTFGGYRLVGERSENLSFERPIFHGEGLQCYARNRLLNAYWFGVKLGIGFVAF